MGDEVVYLQRSLTCASSHQYDTSESNFKESSGIKDILIHQKASNLVIISFLHMQQVSMCGTILRLNNDAFTSSDLIGQKFLNE